MPDIVLAGPADFAGWRAAARGLVAKGVPPGEIRWRVGESMPDLFADAPPPPMAANENGPHFAVPRAFVDLAGAAALHRDPERFSLLYRLLWRIRDDARLMGFASDVDVARVGLLARAVRRDIHKMHAFVRFRAVGAGDEERFVAWYEPDNHIVEAAAPFFMRRFANLRWAILTPERTAGWDGSQLVFGPGASIADAPGEDGLEALWTQYYASTFNPARLNPAMMRTEMPTRFWKNLPEAARIPALIGAAGERTRAMVARPPAPAVVRKGAMMVDAQPEVLSVGLDAVRAAAMDCRDCPLWQPATQTVFGEGPPRPEIVLVGEQPGDQEDLAGRPFVGPAGRMLDRALAEAGIDRARVYVTNAVKHFKFEPRGKRRIHAKPNSLEIRACHQWLEQELALVQPQLTVALGATAAQSLFGRAMPIGANRGRILEFGGGRALITVHPSYLLRLPDEDAKAREYAAFVADLSLAARGGT
jgi:DNA polymerase